MIEYDGGESDLWYIRFSADTGGFWAGSIARSDVHYKSLGPLWVVHTGPLPRDEALASVLFSLCKPSNGCAPNLEYVPGIKPSADEAHVWVDWKTIPGQPHVPRAILEKQPICSDFIG